MYARLFLGPCNCDFSHFPQWTGAQNYLSLNFLAWNKLALMPTICKFIVCAWLCTGTFSLLFLLLSLNSEIGGNALRQFWHFIQRHSPWGRWTSTGRSLSLLSDSQLTVLWIGYLSGLDMFPDTSLSALSYIIVRMISANNVWCQ